MSGHSKWSTIKRKKGAEDIKRGQMFTKFGRMITLAVREGGGNPDPSSNFKLRLAMDKAKQYNMPKENILRAVQRGSGKGGDTDAIESILYEAFGPDGIALIIEAATDNRLRTTAEIKHLLDRSGGSIGAPGSVAYQFEQRGILYIPKESGSEESLFNASVEAGALDLSKDEDMYVVYTKRDELHTVKEQLEQQGFVVKEADLIYYPITHIPLDNRKEEKLLSLLEELEELDDVQKVYANYESA